MKTFLKWAKDNKLDLAENTKRGGLSFNYPPAYIRAQYPHKYFNPILATADLALELRPNTPPDTAASL